MSIGRVLRNISIALSLVLLLVVGLVVYILTLDPNQYRDDITRLAASQGIELRIDGDLAWRFYPELSLQVNSIHLAGSQPELAYTADVGSLELLVELWPLLRRELRLRGLNLDGAQLELTQLAPQLDAELPAEALTEGAVMPSADPSAAPATSVDATPPASALPVLVAERMQISDASLRMLDSQGVETLALAELEIEVENLNLKGDPVQVDGRLGEVRSAGETLVAPLEFALEMNLSPETIVVNLSRLSLQAVLNGTTLPILSSAHLEIDPAAMSFALHSLDVQLAEQAQISFNGTGQADPLGYQGQLDLQVANPRALAAALGQSLPSMAPEALQRFSLQTEVQGSDTQVSLTSLRWQLDQSNFQGNLQLGWGELSSLVFKGQLDRFNLDLYSPPAPETEVAQVEEATAGPLVPVLPFNFSDINLEISNLQVAEIPMQRVHLVLNANTRQMRLQELSAELFGGRMNANALLYTTGDLPHQFEFSATGIAIDQFLATRMAEVPFAGAVTLQLTGLASGLTSAELVPSLEADGRLQAAGLVFRGQDVEQVLCDISDRIERRSLQSNYADWGEATRFQDVNASLRVEDGVARLTSLQSGLGNLGITGQGSFKLTDKNYRLNLSARVNGEQSSVQGCTVHSALREREIPLQCEGNAADSESLQCGIPQEFMRSLLTGALTQQLSNQLLGDDATPEEQANPRKLIEGLLRRSLGQ